MCRERVALFKAVSKGFRKFDVIDTSDTNTTIFSCGACRQALEEFSQGTKSVRPE